MARGLFYVDRGMAALMLNALFLRRAWIEGIRQPAIASAATRVESTPA